MGWRPIPTWRYALMAACALALMPAILGGMAADRAFAWVAGRLRP